MSSPCPLSTMSIPDLWKIWSHSRHSRNVSPNRSLSTRSSLWLYSAVFKAGISWKLLQLSELYVYSHCSERWSTTGKAYEATTVILYLKLKCLPKVLCCLFFGTLLVPRDTICLHSSLDVLLSLRSSVDHLLYCCFLPTPIFS